MPDIVGALAFMALFFGLIAVLEIGARALHSQAMLRSPRSRMAGITRSSSSAR